MESDLSDLFVSLPVRCVYFPGRGEDSGVLKQLPEEEIRKMADTYTDGYIRGFEVMGRDLSKKKTVSVRYPIGLNAWYARQ